MKKTCFWLWQLIQCSSLILAGCCSDNNNPRKGGITNRMLSTFNLQKSQVWIRTLNFRADKDSNNFSAVALDLVIVYDADLFKQMMQMSAGDYFAAKNQLLRDNPQQFDVFHYEIVPGQMLNKQKVNPTYDTGQGAIIFAHYLTSGNHRHALSEEREVNVLLQNKEFIIEKVQ